LLEAPLPVGGLHHGAVAEKGEDLANVGAADHRTQPDAVRVLLRNPDAGIVGEDAQLVEADLPARGRPRLYALHDSDAVIRVDDLLADLEHHVALSFSGTRGPPVGEVEPLERIVASGSRGGNSEEFLLRARRHQEGESESRHATRLFTHASTSRSSL